MYLEFDTLRENQHHEGDTKYGIYKITCVINITNYKSDQINIFHHKKHRTVKTIPTRLLLRAPVWSRVGSKQIYVKFHQYLLD